MPRLSERPASRRDHWLMGRSVVYIFKTAYPNTPGGNKSDNKPYEIGGKVVGDYTIFQGMLKPVQTSTQVLKPLVTASTTPVQSAPTLWPKIQPAVNQPASTQKPAVPSSFSPKTSSQPSQPVVGPVSTQKPPAKKWEVKVGTYKK